MTINSKRTPFATALLLGAALTVSAFPVRGADQPASPYLPSPDVATAAEQRAAYALVHRYEQFLNAGDTTGILDLYADDSVAEWNDKPTFASREEKRAAYDALFKVAKFSTVFGYASVNVYGDTAVVRTFHHEGATVLEGGKKVVDLNREVFVLRKTGGIWKIALYIFNTDPVQGEG